ncbi:MAG: integrase [Casimicrobiaceae bacterium]
MVIDMNQARLDTIEQIREFLAGTADVVFSTTEDQAARHRFVATVLSRHRYFKLSKGHRGVLFAYMQRLTGYTRQHLTKLIGRYRQEHHLHPVTRASRTSFKRRFGPEDIALLAQLDALHNTLSGPATKVVLRRAWQSFGDTRYAKLAGISVSHLYNLRASAGYRKQRIVWSRTRPTAVKIGIRKAPAPQGLPGYIRIDTVHQGDRDGLKGVYHVNAVDIVTQWEVVASVERISEAFLLPVIALMLDSFPFTVLGFHSDCGSEYVNQDIARMLNKLNVEFTKSRPRHCNDNALAESKNGAVVRKTMGYAHIAQKHAAVINQFYADALNPYLNFHRPCYFAVDTIDAKGKVKKTYPQDQIMTPYERLTSIPDYESTLRPDVTAEILQQRSVAMSDNEAAKHVQESRSRLFQLFNHRSKVAA